MRMFAKHAKPKAEDGRENLLSSVVALYLYMSRSAGHRGKEIAFIDHLLRSMFGSEIPLYEIEQARLSELSLREAANILARMLNSADRIKLILNLISLAITNAVRFTFWARSRSLLWLIFCAWM